MDPRDRQAAYGNDYDSFDERRMILVYVISNSNQETDDDPEEVTVELPARYEVCDLCEGKGSHVNPGVDAHGISAEEMYEDPDFAESYFRGTFDVECYRCCGKRVEPVIDEERLNSEQKVLLKMVESAINDRYDYIREHEAERRMGA